MEPSPPLKDSYTVGWIAALSIELTAAIRMLDARHSCPSDFVKSPNDPNVYVWGRIGDHNIAIAFLEAGAYGTTPAATTATYLLSAFPSIKIGLLVGIGAGIRRKDLGFDVRLGDVVISQPDGKSGGVYQYDLIKARSGDNAETIGILNRPSTFLLKVLELVKAQHLAEPSKVTEYLKLITPNMANPPDGTPGFVYQGVQNDRLFKSTFQHVSVPVGNESPRHSELGQCDDDDDDSDSDEPSLACPHCPPEQEVKRKQRRSGSMPRFHYGTIASGNTLVKDAEERGKIMERVPGSCICIDMEAAGLMDNFPCLVIRGICDYADSHKNDRWQPYAALTAAAYAKEFLGTVPGVEVQLQTPLAMQLEGIAEKVDEIRATTTTTNMTLQLAELRDWLSPPEPSNNYLAAIHERNKGAGGTGGWFLRSKKFSQWESTEKSFLWMHGLAGCGKTVLCSTVIEHLAANSLPGCIVLYYYFSFKDAHTRSRSSLIRSLVMQLSQQNECAMKDLLQLHSEYSRSQPSDEKLIEVFNTMISHLNCTMLILDGLDELEREKRPDILQWIGKAIDNTVTSDIRILASSRSEHDIERKFRRLHLEVQLLPEDVQQDIKSYVRKQIHDEESGLRRWRQKPNVQQEIERKLTQKAQGMFRWVVCQMQAIEECLDLRSLRESLDSLPESLDETYERMVQEMLKRKRQGAITLLQFLAFSAYPIRLDEAVDIVAVDLSTSPPFNPEYRMPDELEIVKICSSLVVLERAHDGDDQFDDASQNAKRKLQLAHFSVKEYLVSDRLQEAIQRYFSPINAHSSIVNISLGYLASILPATGGDWNEGSMNYPFLHYAGWMWPEHAKIGENNNETVRRIHDFFRDSHILVIWFSFFLRRNLQDMETGMEALTPPLLSILLNLPKTALWLVNGGATIEAQSLSQRMHQSLGKFGRLGEIVYVPEDTGRNRVEFRSTGEQPIAKQKRVSGPAPSLTSLLYLASSKGFYDVVRALIARGMDVHGIGGRYGTPLNAACYFEHHDIFSLLLEHSDKKRHDYRQYIKSALDIALHPPRLKSRPNDHTMINQLVAMSAHLDYPQSSLNGCLIAALILGYVDLAKRLVAKGAFFDELANTAWFRRDEDPHCNFLHETPKDNSGDVQPGGISLRYKPSLSTTRLWQSNSLDGIPREPGIRSVQFIPLPNRKLSLEPEYNTPDCSILHRACANSFYTVIHFLVSHGADRHVVDHYGRTPLLFAILRKDERATNILLEIWLSPKPDNFQQDNESSFAFVNIPDIHGFTPLHWSTQKRCTNLVRLLLLRGADTNVRDREGKTALHYAAENKHLEIFKLLAQNGADMDIRDRYQNTPLDCARASTNQGDNVVLWWLSRGCKAEDRRNVAGTASELENAGVKGGS